MIHVIGNIRLSKEYLKSVWILKLVHYTFIAGSVTLIFETVEVNLLRLWAAFSDPLVSYFT